MEKIGKYQILSEIGRGGMGVVYKAVDPLLEETRAIKVIHPELLRDGEFRTRFLSEAKMLNKLLHENIVRFYEVGEDSGQMFIVTELLEGKSVADTMKESSSPLKDEDVFLILKGVASGLSFAHKRGILHRDIKPANIFITEEDGFTVKLLDFGLAKTTGELTLTASGMAVGTPQYVPPEVLDGKRATPASDIYSLGIAAFKMITGQMPINLPEELSSVMAITLAIYKAHQAGVPKVQSINPSTDKVLAGIVDKMLSTLESERYSDGEELRIALMNGYSTDSKEDLLGKEKDYDMTRLSIPSFGEKKKGGISSEKLSVQSSISVSDNTDDKTSLNMPAFEGSVSVEKNVNSSGGISYRKEKRAGAWLNYIVFATLIIVLVSGVWLFGVQRHSEEREKEDKESCVEAETKNSIEAWESYLEKYPEGVCALKAKDFLNESIKELQTMATIPAGWFWMGCSPSDTGCHDLEKPGRKVYLDEFKIDRIEVTVKDYRQCVVSGVCTLPSTEDKCTYSLGLDHHPVNCVDWYQAQKYCEWMGKRLPTEAEWEKAARGGTETIFYCGDDESCLDRIAWYAKNSGGTTRPVGRKEPNAFGLYDMIGNVWEWVSDWYSEVYYSRAPEKNPRGPDRGRWRIVRGGSWDYVNPRDFRSSNRDHDEPHDKFNNNGFRCAQ